MRFTLSGFRQFVEDMDRSRDKEIERAGELGASEEAGKEDYFGGLGDEMGIEWKNIVKSLESEPWVSSHFPLGKPNKEVLYKLAAWEIVPGSMTPHGADIRLRHNRGDRSYLSGNRLNKGEPDDRRYHLSRQELINFLTTGWTPAVQNAQGAAAGGAMPGAPPM